MYIPNYFLEQDGLFVEEVINTYDFAILVISKNDSIEINHIPLIYYPNEFEKGVLKGHFAKANPVVSLLDEIAKVTAIFNGPHCYVSPSWYAHPKGHVPTWNYVVVHAQGKIEKRTDPLWLKKFLTDMAQKYENRESAWSPDYSDKKIEGLLDGIIGFEIKISNLKAKSKLSQNRNEKDYTALLKNLKQSDDENTRQIAALMESRGSLNDLSKHTEAYF